MKNLLKKMCRTAIAVWCMAAMVMAVVVQSIIGTDIRNGTESYVHVLGDIPGDADDWSLGDLGGGVMNLAELSLLPDLISQPDDFSPTTVFFTGSAAGTSSLFFSDVDLGDQLGDPITGPFLETGSLTVVPEPAALLLLGSGLAGLVGLRRKVRN